MRTRKIAGFEVSAIGLGCMNLSHAYGVPPSPEAGGRLLNAALDLGYTFLDTAALYGFGANETLIGQAVGERRGEYLLASKCGMFRNAQGQREIDGRPEVIKRTCEDSLRRLRTDVIDLYYLHRMDPRVPIEDSVGALAELVDQGKIRAIGLSEVSAATLRRAHAIHPIAAVQSEYSLWTRNPEIAILDACDALDVAFVAFSPVGRGFLAGAVRETQAMPANDLRRTMPRFQDEHFQQNLRLLAEFTEIADQTGVSRAELALAWVLAKGERVTAIPGTTRLDHLAENARASNLELDRPTLLRLERLFRVGAVSGPRYGAATQAEIDTEEFSPMSLTPTSLAPESFAQ